MTFDAGQKAIRHGFDFRKRATRPIGNAFFGIERLDMIQKAMTVRPTATFTIFGHDIKGATDDSFAVFPMTTEINQIVANCKNQMSHCFIPCVAC